VRRLHGAGGRQAGALLRHPDRLARQRRDHNIEGLGTPDKPHALQKAFIEEQAVQCGYCINGMIMSAKELLDRKPNVTESEVKDALAGNLCRCGTHNRIVSAVLRAAREMTGTVGGRT
jgi:aerobic-type carbon monoxide dehydrogenase small subunit (CoxS/CutS family)